MANHLFKAFSQEDTLSEGTGLGMSMVAKIVKAVGGKMEVQSAKGFGTTIKVTVPLEQSHSTDDGDELERQKERRRLRKYSIGIMRNEDVNAGHDQSPHRKGLALLFASLQKTCAELGIRTVKSSFEDIGAADVYLVSEAELAHRQQPSAVHHETNPITLQYLNAFADRPLIALCNSAVSERRLRAAIFARKSNMNVEFISQPAGPGTLAKALKSCLRRLPGGKPSGTQVLPTRDTHPASIQERSGTVDFRQLPIRIDSVRDDAGLATPQPAVNPAKPNTVAAKAAESRRSVELNKSQPNTPPAIVRNAKRPLTLLLVDDNVSRNFCSRSKSTSN